MSCERIGYHYCTCAFKSIVKRFKAIEDDVLHDNMHLETLLVDEMKERYPKMLAILYDNVMSAFPYSPQPPDIPYDYRDMICVWLKFNTRRNSYAQKNGSLVVLEDCERCMRHLELWKTGELLQKTDLSIDGQLFSNELAEFCSKMANIFTLPQLDINTGELFTFDMLERWIGKPLLQPERWGEHYDLIEETPLMLIVKPKA